MHSFDIDELLEDQELKEHMSKILRLFEEEKVFDVTSYGNVLKGRHSP